MGALWTVRRIILRTKRFFCQRPCFVQFLRPYFEPLAPPRFVFRLRALASLAAVSACARRAVIFTSASAFFRSIAAFACSWTALSRCFTSSMLSWVAFRFAALALSSSSSSLFEGLFQCRLLLEELIVDHLRSESPKHNAALFLNRSSTGETQLHSISARTATLPTSKGFSDVIEELQIYAVTSLISMRR